MKVAVIGATGMVGSVMLKVLEKRKFPITELILVASERSIGKKVSFFQRITILSMQEALSKNQRLPSFQQGQKPLWSGPQVCRSWCHGS